MDIQYYGANCIRISTKKASVIVDDNLKSLGLAAESKKDEVAIKTFAGIDSPKDAKIVIDAPGEYEVSGVSIKGIAARAHMDEPKQKTATMYKLDVNDIRVVVTGHIFADLSDDQLESLGTVDVLIIPVGNAGYTLDAIGASKVIRKIEPKLVIPTHYGEKGINYEVPQQSLDEALKELPFEVKARVPKLKLKESDLPELTELIVVERQQ